MSALPRHDIQTLLLPVVTLAAVLAPIFWINPNTISYFGLGLLLNLAVPMILASMAQLCIIAVNDLDLSIGAFVSLVSCIAVTWLPEQPLLALAIHSGQGLKITPPELLASFATGWLLRLPLLAWAVLVVTLARTLFGRHLSALGQNARAAWLAGISVERIRCLCYVLCAVCAAMCALLIAGFSGGASLDMGNEYLLMSVAAVVIGGTSATGGRPSVAGIWGAALFLYFTNTLLNVVGLSAGGRSVLTGVIIIAVIVLSARRRQYR